MAGEDLVELKFRLADGTGIGPSKYSSATTVASLKEKIHAQWPKDKENCPKTIQDVKLINDGKVLENNRTLAESRLPVGELAGGVITMHVVLGLPLSDKNNGNPQPMYLIRCIIAYGRDSRAKAIMHFLTIKNKKQQNDCPKKSSCSCAIF